jgi:hypothetical protein
MAGRGHFVSDRLEVRCGSGSLDWCPLSAYRIAIGTLEILIVEGKGD